VDDEFLDGMVLLGAKRLVPAIQICYGEDIQLPHLADRRKGHGSDLTRGHDKVASAATMSNVETYTKRNIRPKSFRAADW